MQYKYLFFPFFFSLLFLAFFLFQSSSTLAQAQKTTPKTTSPIPTTPNALSKVWVADNGDGTYKNPILYADYSDPDVCRVGDDFYMTASSFNCIPGLPILHSRDLVNWSLVAYALDRQPPYDHFAKPQHGNGVWAPSIRYHKGEFYIFYPDPDFGIYRIKAKSATGPWETPVLIKSGKGLIDPCPLWDEDGKAYLVHAFAGSRAGIKSVLVVNKMDVEATKMLDEGVLVFDGHNKHPTLEGPKFYKRNGYYYIMAPAGGVATGWQMILRSKNIYGPYEEKIVLDQGSTSVNGPHQGAWVELTSGESWFFHFQDLEAYGRVVHLQPVKWVNDWPVMGVDKDGDGKGEPVLTYKKPNVGKTYPRITPPDTDEFTTHPLGLQWQWHANPQATWAFPNSSEGYLRLFSYQLPESFKNYWDVPNLVLQKFPAPTFTATTQLTFSPSEKLQGEKVGLMVMGMNYSYLSLSKTDKGIYLSHSTCTQADKGNAEKETSGLLINTKKVWFRVKVAQGAICQFSYSTNGTDFTDIGSAFTAKPGRWIGAKIGFFCTRPTQTNDSGFADVDWFRVEK
ncbi:glycoside hydrolase 43 family protein [Cytophagaceae bacterium DM2B3-1]|uniref:Glycoside hydrolase 43 family protein n=1 Tax=Xanthocytophaga flava TaxID=3048013 RepID=A0ABT7D0X3_9BACT|nr:glycoside hydrolase 43 family protein [Xanthocytophaga flavus]MDJ1466770.1 glycoside hydrolase 43 family protein [Xanthocytophaga flavus]MDJ1498444.1 glycoside hydrolase 43 family protein [Xanthocytophaga flavus]